VSQRLDRHEVAPAVLTPPCGLEQYIRTSTLEPALLELVKLRASLINGCAYRVWSTSPSPSSPSTPGAAWPRPSGARSARTPLPSSRRASRRPAQPRSEPERQEAT
jgi:hypothetical protein